VRGDVIAYANGKAGHPYQHCTLYLGDDKVACHTVSRFNLDYTDVEFETGTYVTYIHIK